MTVEKDFFKTNRQKLGENLNGAVIVLSAYTQLQRGNDAAFGFEQEANFWYLTGIEAPDWWVIIDGGRSKSWLVVPEVSDVHQIFDGSLSATKAQAISGTDGVLSQDEAMRMLRDQAKKHSVVYGLGDDPHTEHFDFTLNPAPRKMWQVLERTFNEVQDCRLDLAKLRAIKQPAEITMIKKAIKLTVDSFKNVKEKLSTFQYEYEVEAEFSYAFRQAGATGHAYDPIVAGGKNACTLHYSANTDKLKKNSILLMDIGARVGGYAADITRSFAVGLPTARQVDVHAALQDAHQRIIGLLGPGVVVTEYQRQVDEIMQQALRDLKLLNSPEEYRRYFPHAISHGLGIDVHDSLGRPTELRSGMVLTVEPGIYIPDEAIGIRIEDDILITDKGHTNLSGALPTAL